MTETFYKEDVMTLAEILPAVRQFSTIDKIRLIRVLAEDLDTHQDCFPLEPNKVYDLPTPYNLFGVAEPLMAALQISEPKR
jgi:hypothetical protein